MDWFVGQFDEAWRTWARKNATTWRP